MRGDLNLDEKVTGFVEPSRDPGPIRRLGA
jgi:hypothetical protein